MIPSDLRGCQETADLAIPRHVAAIMDGNGRWARQRGLPRINGHFEGRRATRRCVAACSEIGIEYLSIYAFSTENWRRSSAEVQGLLSLIEISLWEELDELNASGVRLIASGRIHELPDSLQHALADCVASTAANTNLTLNLMVNYGGRAELTDAARSLARRAAAGELDPGAIDEAALAGELYHPELPDPDILLRPGGESRLSNFLLWQVAYSEIIVLPVLWPDFDREHLWEAIREYNRRQRRFGGVVDME